MQYDSVSSLKKEIRKGLDFGDFLAGSLVEAGLQEPLQVSLGVRWVHGNEYHLAVRVRQGSPLATEALRLKTELITKGELDFRVTGRAHIIDGCQGSVAQVTTLNIGGSIGHKGFRGGSLGFFAKRRGDGKPGFVSANHVIALNQLPTQNPDDDDVVHPSLCDSALGPPVTIARLDHHFPLLDTNQVATADCAFAELLPGMFPANPGALQGVAGTLTNTPAPEIKAMNVFKIGRTTGKTAGKVIAFHFDKLVVEKYPFGPVHFIDQIEIESVNGSAFSSAGDSGSLVFDENNNPVGLLFADTSGGTEADDQALHYATSIQTVLDALQVDIAV